MNYFENVFKNVAGRNEKIGLASIKLNHPVLYVFLSTEENAVDIIDKINSLYEKKLKDASDIKYLCFNENEKLLRESLNDLQAGFLRREYVNSIYRRVYIVLDTNETDYTLIRRAVEFIGSFFRSVNNVPLIDLFVLTDERMVGDKEKGEKISAIYRELIAIYNSSNMIYLLSNFTSNSILLDTFDEHYNAIVLCSILKDCSSDSSRSGAFDEKMFKENCKIQKHSGKFYTIGTKKIDLPTDILNAVIIREMIDSSNSVYKIDTSEMAEKFQSLRGKLLRDLDILYEECLERCCRNVTSLAFDIEKIGRANYLTNWDVLDAIFGKSAVDAFYEINIDEGIDFDAISGLFEDLIDDCLYSVEYGFFLAKEFFKYLLSEEFPEIVRGLKKDVEENEKQLKMWLESNSSSDRSQKMGMFSRIYTYPFEIAKEYISRQGYLSKSVNTLKIFEKWETGLYCYVDNINRICDQLDESKKYLSSYISSKLNGKPLVIRENFENYYKEKATEYIKGNYQDYFELVYKGFYQTSTEDIDLIYGACLEYAEKIMATAGFEENIYEEIFNRILASEYTQFDTREKISEQLYKEMLNDRVYFCNLMFKEGLYETTCFITGNGGFAEQLGRKIGQNIFFDEVDRTLNLIYMMGVFSAENLFYAKQYNFQTPQAGSDVVEID